MGATIGTQAYPQSELDLLFIGYGYDQQMCLFPLPSEGHDIRLNRAITPTTVYNFD